MAPPRPYWKGYLKLSLVSCPIALYSATASGERVSFRQVNIVIGFEMLALCLLYVGVMPPTGRRTTWSDSLEAGMLLILIVLFSPLSFTYNNGWLMLPIASVIYFILFLARSKRERKTAGVWLGLCMVLMLVGLPVPGFRLLRDGGNTFWADIVILA